LKEKSLKSYEDLLDADQTSFEAFLTKNDSNAHKALEAAEKATKLKQEKISEAKKLQFEINKLDAEIERYESDLVNVQLMLQ